jgi:hypothetical protein
MAKKLRLIKVTFSIPAALIAPFVWLLLLYRRIRYGYTFRRIPLTRGEYAIVDPEDYPRLSRYKWHAVKCKAARTYYAKRARPRGCRKSDFAHLMHRYIIKVPPGMVIDHINHNGLDNRNANVRIATHAQNSRNTRKQRPKTASKYKGVTWNRPLKKWRAQITRDGKRISLGCFSDEIEAAKAYDIAAKKYHGRFASTNFPP